MPAIVRNTNRLVSERLTVLGQSHPRWKSARRCSSSWCFIRPILPCRSGAVTTGPRSGAAKRSLAVLVVRPVTGRASQPVQVRRNLTLVTRKSWPYSDLLLHDMGEGLADGRPDGMASGREWRTPPLWGIGLTGTVSGHTFFLHDGRARNLTEAIVWHGGGSRPCPCRFHCACQAGSKGFARIHQLTMIAPP